MSSGATKICSKCNKDLPNTDEYFIIRKNAKDGLGGVCRICSRKYYKQYRIKNKNNISKSNKKWNDKNKEYHQHYSNNHKNDIRKNKKKWAIKNRDYLAMKQAQKRVVIKNQTPDNIDKTKIINMYLWSSCFELITGKKYHVDHIVPIAKGGPHHQDNLQILEAKDNIKKSDKTETDVIGFSYQTLRDMYYGGNK